MIKRPLTLNTFMSVLSDGQKKDEKPTMVEGGGVPTESEPPITKVSPVTKQILPEVEPELKLQADGKHYIENIKLAIILNVI